MSDRNIPNVHIGSLIQERIKELNLTKSEFGRRIGISQQHINRILEKPNIDTDRLRLISDVLDFNFFTYYCTPEDHIQAINSAVNTGKGTANHIDGNLNSGNTNINAPNSALNLGEGGAIHINGEYPSDIYQVQVSLLEDYISQLKSQLADKQRIIELLENEKM